MKHKCATEGCDKIVYGKHCSSCHISLTNKKRSLDPEFREKISKSIKDSYTTELKAIRSSDAIKQMQESPEVFRKFWKLGLEAERSEEQNIVGQYLALV